MKCDKKKKQRDEEMSNLDDKMIEYINLLDKYTSEDGVFTTSIDNLFLYRGSKPHRCTPEVYGAGIALGAQGKKHVYLNSNRYNYHSGNFMTLFVPFPLECEVIEASLEKPLLGAGLYFDQSRLSKILVKIEQEEPTLIQPEVTKASAIFSARINENLLDAFIRLLKTLDKPGEGKILGELIIDEIYFRILSEEQGGSLLYYLKHNGQIHQIYKVVEYVHQNLDKPLLVDDLASIIHMSSSDFYKKFKEVMHLSPLQYAKSIKLNKARAYLMEGKSVSETSYMVGYNSPAQFSREYKRHFGVVPSAT